MLVNWIKKTDQTVRKKNLYFYAVIFLAVTILVLSVIPGFGGGLNSGFSAHGLAYFVFAFVISLYLRTPAYRAAPLKAALLAGLYGTLIEGIQFFIPYRAFELTDMVRIDHFRGFAACWEIPASAPTAETGKWVKVPGRELFAAVEAALGKQEIVAEHLGVITEDVDQLREDLGLPGMAVLQFAFDGGPENPYLPHNLSRNTVVYPGTHDNDTTLGWYQSLDEETQNEVHKVLGPSSEPMPWYLIHAALCSPCRLAVVPMQDLLGLGSESRMNTPGTTQSNWKWRFLWSQVPKRLAGRFHGLAQSCIRI